jgi:hypothetical protein
METLHLLLRILLRLEEKSAETAGILPMRRAGSAVEDAPDAGMIMAEGGRVCWASSPHSSRRLSDLLLDHSGISRSQIERVFQFCRRTGKPLGEHMVSLGILTRELLREALLSHTTAALLTLGQGLQKGEVAPTPFQRSPERSYNPMFTFSALELVVAMIRQDPELQVAVGSPPTSFARRASRVRYAICFWETAWSDLPAVPVLYGGDALDAKLGEALQIFRLCRSDEHLAVPGGTESHSSKVLLHQDGYGWLASYGPPFLCLYRLDHRSEM